MNQLTMFESTDHKHIPVTDKPPHAGWKADEMGAHCGECWQWIDSDGNAPAIGDR